MYVVSDKFKSAIESTSRSMSCKAYLRGIELSVDKILKLDIEDNINNGDYFTIGEKIIIKIRDISLRRLLGYLFLHNVLLQFS